MARPTARPDPATEVIDIDAEVVDVQPGPPAGAWALWSMLLQEAGTAWWRLQADAWQQQVGWWTAVMQGRLPLAQAIDIAEAEAEHAANPLAASPLWMPAQEATRQFVGVAVTQWNDWLGLGGRGAYLFDRPAR